MGKGGYGKDAGVSDEVDRRDVELELYDEEQQDERSTPEGFEGERGGISRSAYKNFNDDLLREPKQKGSFFTGLVDCFSTGAEFTRRTKRVKNWLLEECCTWWFLSLFGASYMALFSGTLYGFSIYSIYLKQRLEFTPFQLGIVGAAGNLGIYTGGPMGMFFDRFGPKITVILAGILLSIGYFGVYAALLDWVPHHYLIVAAFFFVIGQGSHGTYISCIGTNVWNVKSIHAGKAIGWTASLLALSGAFMVVVYRIFFEGEPANFLLFMSVITLLVNLVGSLVITKFPRAGEEEGVNVNAATLAAATTPSLATSATGTFTTTPKSSSLSINNSDGTEVSGDTATNAGVKKIEIEMGVPQVWRTSRWWLLFSVSFVALGTGLMYIFNLGSYIAAMGGTGEMTRSNVLIFAFSSAGGRLGIGSLSDLLQSKVPRTMFLLGICILNILLYLTLGFIETLSVITLFTIMIGILYGGTFAMIPCALKDFYGAKHLGQNFGWISLSAALGILFFNIISSKLYEAQIDSGSGSFSGSGTDSGSFSGSGSGSFSESGNGSLSESTLCYGLECYRYAFFFGSIMNAAVSVVAFFLLKRAILRSNWQQSVE